MKRWFSLIVAVQTLFIVGEAASYTIQARTGQEVILKVLPVDPRSVFMGNYMALQFDISRLDTRTVPFSDSGATIKAGEPIFVAVAPGKPWAKPVAASVDRSGVEGRGSVVLRGTVTSVEQAGGANTRPTMLHVDYGINRFYFPEARQETVTERMRRPDGSPAEITVTVSVPPSGRPIPRAVRLDGWPVPGKG
jgi:uncharacterized membrane-anchored protein